MRESKLIEAGCRQHPDRLVWIFPDGFELSQIDFMGLSEWFLDKLIDEHCKAYNHITLMDDDKATSFLLPHNTYYFNADYTLIAQEGNYYLYERDNKHYSSQAT